MDCKHGKKGDLGGWVESEFTSSGDASVYGNAWVSGNAMVSGNAELKSNNDYCTFSNFGSVNRTTTFFKTKEKNIIKVVCGCFYGTIKDFTKKVKETHSDNKHSKEYLSMVRLVKIKFGL